MNTQAKSFAISIAIHILVVGFFSFLSMAEKLPARTILLDFTLMEAGGGGGSGGGAGEQDALQHKGGIKNISKEEVASAAKNIPARAPGVAVDQPVISGAEERKEIKKISGNPLYTDPKGEVALYGAEPNWPAGGKGENFVGQAVPGENGGSGKSSADNESAFGRGAVGDRTFAYIRQLILRNVHYPRKARAMGWQGRVVLSFTLFENGSVKDLKILESSGYPLLDGEAKEAILKTRFPKKIHTSRLVILPITYRLEGAATE